MINAAKEARKAEIAEAVITFDLKTVASMYFPLKLTVSTILGLFIFLYELTVSIYI